MTSKSSKKRPKNPTDEFTEEQLETFREVFLKFEIGDTDTIPTSAIGDVLRMLGRTPTEAEVKELADIDTDASGRLDWIEYLTLVSTKLDFDGLLERELYSAFAVFDKEGRGYVNAKRLMHVMTSMGDKLTEDEAKDLIEKAEPNDFGLISYKAFARVMYKLIA